MTIWTGKHVGAPLESKMIQNTAAAEPDQTWPLIPALLGLWAKGNALFNTLQFKIISTLKYHVYRPNLPRTLTSMLTRSPIIMLDKVTLIQPQDYRQVSHRGCHQDYSLDQSLSSQATRPGIADPRSPTRLGKIVFRLLDLRLVFIPGRGHQNC